MRSLKKLSIALCRFDSNINLWGIKWLLACPLSGEKGWYLCGSSERCHEERDRLEAILYPTSHLIKGSVRFDDRFETAHPSPNRF